MKYLSWTGLQHFYSKYIGNLNEQLKNVKKRRYSDKNRYKARKTTKNHE